MVFVAACIVVTGCGQRQGVREPESKIIKKSPPEAKEQAPLLLEDKPMLLDDEPQSAQPDHPQADNSRCFVCHINYMQEDIAVIHAGAGIGCANCHGQSDKHIADESWASGGNGTPPDIMYPPAKINPFCMSCHAKDKIDTDQHKPLFANIDKMVCTDCHGSHRLAVRTCKWK